MNIKIIGDFREKLLKNLEKVILGKNEVLNLVIMGLICRGHLLIDDVPGVGKTMLAKSLAISLGSRFHRIQFTPDMLPRDINGVSFYNQKRAFPRSLLRDCLTKSVPKGEIP